jgi:hypothetical protein
MFFNRKTFISGLFSAIVLAGCAPALYQPMPEHASGNVTHEDLLKGRSLYVNSCGSCHSLYVPDQYNEKVWKENLDEMQERSKITDPEKALILAYLTHAPVKATKK